MTTTLTRASTQPRPAVIMVHCERDTSLWTQVGADGWFCIPHRADANYIENFSQLVHSTLRPERKIYVEFSNEVT